VTNYIPHYTKKRQILARRENALRRLISSGSPIKKLFDAAEAVRDARIRVLRAQRALIVPINDAQKDFNIIDARIQEIKDAPIEAILLEFGYHLAIYPGSDNI
jgi:hypothetical protein